MERKVVLPLIAVIALGIVTIIGSGGGDDAIIPPFDLYEGLAIDDLNGDGLADIAVAYRHVAAPPPHPAAASVTRMTRIKNHMVRFIINFSFTPQWGNN